MYFCTPSPDIPEFFKPTMNESFDISKSYRLRFLFDGTSIVPNSIIVRCPIYQTLKLWGRGW